VVIQSTGWGNISIYFISTKTFRDRGMGPTIIVSPLLALMRNQIESVQRLGIIAETMNSTNQRTKVEKFCHDAASGDLVREVAFF